MLSHHPRSRRPTLRSTRRARGQHGYVMVTFALLLVPLLLMVGFAVDVGGWYNRASDMRRAADAAALAGVVWLPDEDAAETAALEAAARNGFVRSSTISITVQASAKADRRLQVTITDSRVGSFFYQSLGGREIDLSRTSYAEYVLSVPMGSPRNFFGTGTLLRDHTGPGIPSENLYQSVNTYCSDKVNGDRYQSGYSGSTCAGSSANSEYRTEGYSMYIEAPEGRPADIDVRLYDARYNMDKLTWTVPGPDDCVTTENYLPTNSTWYTSTSGSNVTIIGPAQYATRTATSGSGSGYGGTQTLAFGSSYTRQANLLRYRTQATWSPSTTTWTTSTSSTNVTVNAPAQYQTRGRTTDAWSATVNLQSGSITRARNLIQYRTATLVAPTTTCTPTTVTMSEDEVDYNLGGSGAESFTYSLYGADNTPLNDGDNPLICQETFTRTTPFDGYDYLGSKRWNSLCTISRTARSGRYVLRATNGGVVTNPIANATNQWGLVAKYANSGVDGLCDGRNDVMCPRVYGKDAISVKAASDANVASFFLAEIEREHSGKKLRLQLFDPGEGGNKIEIMAPSGTNGNTWTAVPFSWTAPGLAGGNNVSSVSVTNNVFNGKQLEITIDLNGYNPPSNNQWWQIRYTFTSGVVVTDRTTWSARIIGDPVHLVEEY